MSWSDKTVWSPLKRDSCKLPVPSSPKIVSGGSGGGGAAIFFIQPQVKNTTVTIAHKIPILRFIDTSISKAWGLAKWLTLELCLIYKSRIILPSSNLECGSPAAAFLIDLHDSIFSEAQ